MNNNKQQTMTIGHCSSFGCHVAISDVAPGFRVNKINERGGCGDSPNVDGDDVVRPRERATAHSRAPNLL